MKHDWDDIERLIQEIIDYQKRNLMKTGRAVIPALTVEDVLQPNDYPELENNPLFRYEEGIVAGVQMVQTALRALKNEKKK